ATHDLVGSKTIRCQQYDLCPPNMLLQTVPISNDLMMLLTAPHLALRCHSQHIQHHFRSSPVSRRLETIPGIGPVIATAISASVTDPAIFRSGRASQPG
ncbi:MAG: transposase, partial [Alphaproteobacteria bacterium GM202ARS2]|nr:transposase [Alphaproteobacteria bacterium GM202ARS2]